MNDHPPVLEVIDLVVKFPVSRKKGIHAVSGVGFRIPRGETLGLVGESGCGKTSLARALMQLPGPTSGRVLFCGEDLTSASPGRLRELRPRFQMIMQDSISSLNPRRKVGESIAMTLKTKPPPFFSRAERRRLVQETMDRVGLDPDHFDRFPYQFSGGQCQRIQIARALIAKPDLIICDEPVSSLDVSVQAQILNLLEDLRTDHHLTMMFISHDLAVVKNISDRTAVMYKGRIVELAPSDNLYQNPRHPYTRVLLSACPDPDPAVMRPQIVLNPCEMPTPTAPPEGCGFHARCPLAEDPCRKSQPSLLEVEPGHWAACFFPGSERREAQE